MEWFLNQIINWEKFELLIDTKIFNKDIILKAAYNFLDKWYFFFKYNDEKNIILQFTKKVEIKEKPEIIIWDFSDELLSVYLRDKLENDNKEIREKIVWTAISSSLDVDWFVNYNLDENKENENEIDFDKDIDEILKEIENDPELKIDEEEIEKILKEIEEETEEEQKDVKVDVEWVKKAKQNFNK